MNNDAEWRQCLQTAAEHGVVLARLEPAGPVAKKKDSAKTGAGKKYMQPTSEPGETGEDDEENEPGKRKTKPAGTAEQTEDLDEQWADLLQKIKEGKL
jgi:hypothetical protein